MLTVYTFGDSILDCGRYNARGITPGQLLVRNEDALFPEFRGRDLNAHGPVRLVHRAVDGATVDRLPAQARGLEVAAPALALVTIGGNDLILGLVTDPGTGIAAFEAALDDFVRALPMRPIFLGNVYDPTFGDDCQNFLGVDPALARANFTRVNAADAAVAARHGHLVDLHTHFLTGEPSWFTQTIEPSLTGASEVRRCFLHAILDSQDTLEASTR